MIPSKKQKVRLMLGLLMLKQFRNASDESAIKQWLRTLTTPIFVEHDKQMESIFLALIPKKLFLLYQTLLE